MTRYDPGTIIPIFIALVVVIAVVFAYTGRMKFLNQTLAEVTTHNSPSPMPTEIPSATPSPTPISSQREVILAPSPTPSFSPTPRATTMAQTNTYNNNSNDLNQFRYPNAKIISSSNSEIRLESSDSPDKITDWYKEKIKNLGMNTQSFVTTNTNNNVLNSLASAGNGLSIKVEIKRDAGSSTTSIKLSQ